MRRWPAHLPTVPLLPAGQSCAERVLTPTPHADVTERRWKGSCRQISPLRHDMVGQHHDFWCSHCRTASRI